MDELKPCRLDECPPGLFMFGGVLGFRSKYGAQTGKDIGGGMVEWKVTHWPDAYCVESGEFFWGGAKTHEDRAALIVQPIAAWNTRTNPHVHSDVVEAACNMSLRSAVFAILRRHAVSEQCFAEVAAVTHKALQARPDTALVGELEVALKRIETILQETPERSNFVDDLAQQQDQALIEIHEISQKALKSCRDADRILTALRSNHDDVVEKCAMTHDEAIDAICGCAQTVTVLSYQEAIEGYLKLRGWQQ